MTTEQDLQRRIERLEAVIDEQRHIISELISQRKAPVYIGPYVAPTKPDYTGPWYTNTSTSTNRAMIDHAA